MPQNNVSSMSVPSAVPGSALSAPASSRVQKTPDICGGDACIRNTRIAVWMLVNASRLGLADQELLTQYDPPLTQADLDAAWEYYGRNREEIELAIQEHEGA